MESSVRGLIDDIELLSKFLAIVLGCRMNGCASDRLILSVNMFSNSKETISYNIDSILTKFFKQKRREAVRRVTNLPPILQMKYVGLSYTKS